MGLLYREVTDAGGFEHGVEQQPAVRAPLLRRLHQADGLVLHEDQGPLQAGLGCLEQPVASLSSNSMSTDRMRTMTPGYLASSVRSDSHNAAVTSSGVGLGLRITLLSNPAGIVRVEASTTTLMRLFPGSPRWLPSARLVAAPGRAVLNPHTDVDLVPVAIGLSTPTSGMHHQVYALMRVLPSIQSVRRFGRYRPVMLARSSCVRW